MMLAGTSQHVLLITACAQCLRGALALHTFCCSLLTVGRGRKLYMYTPADRPTAEIRGVCVLQYLTPTVGSGPCMCVGEGGLHRSLPPVPEFQPA